MDAFDEMIQSAIAEERAAIIAALRELQYEPRDSMDTSYLYRQDGVDDAIELIAERGQ